MLMVRRQSTYAALILLWSAAWAAGAATPPAAALEPPEVTALLEQGRQLSSQSQFAAAAKAFLAAAEAADGPCDECLLGMARAVSAASGGGTMATNAGEAIDALRAALLAEPASPLAREARQTLCLARPSAAIDLPDEDGEPLHAGGAVTQPHKDYGRPPRQTEAMRQDPVQGVVILDGIIDRYGCVTEPRVRKGLRPDADQAALAAVKRWVFRPAQLQEKPVKVYWTLIVNFM